MLTAILETLLTTAEKKRLKLYTEQHKGPALEQHVRALLVAGLNATIDGEAGEQKASRVAGKLERLEEQQRLAAERRARLLADRAELDGLERMLADRRGELREELEATSKAREEAAAARARAEADLIALTDEAPEEEGDA